MSNSVNSSELIGVAIIS